MIYSDIGIKGKYRFQLTIFDLWCLNLVVKSVEDLKRLLKETGYSTRAVEEILKWYTTHNS